MTCIGIILCQQIQARIDKQLVHVDAYNIQHFWESVAYAGPLQMHSYKPPISETCNSLVQVASGY